MMTPPKKLLWIAISTCTGCIVTFYALQELLLHPASGITDMGGDGIKNIFTYLYQSCYGKGYWFTGMNYPYGEHIVFTDGIPLLSVPLASPLIHNVSATTALGIMWWAIALSYIAANGLLFLVLLEFDVVPCIAAIGAALITIYSPQLLGVQSHYALSFACIIPALFLWTIRYHKTGKLKFPLFIFLLGTLAAWLHPYYVAMILLWAGFYTIAYFFFVGKSFTQKLRHAAPLLLAAIASFGVFGIVMKCTDPITDRPVTPHGALDNRTGGRQIFTSHHSPFWHQLLHRHLVSKITEGGEGYTYIGLACILVILVGLAWWLFHNIYRRSSSTVTQTNNISLIWPAMAVLALLLSMGVPFIFRLEWMLDYVSVFRQFRAIGRFSWMYYYLITVIAVTLVDHWRRALSGGRLRYVGLLITILFFATWAYEATGYTRFTRALAKAGKKNADFFFFSGQPHWKDFLSKSNHSPNDFQAVLALGMVHIGSEKFWVGEDRSWLMVRGFSAAYDLKIPLVDVEMSRTSWSQTKNLLKTGGGPFADKPLFHQFNNHKPFLLVWTPDCPLNPDEAYLLDAAIPLGAFSGCFVYALNPDLQLLHDGKWCDSALHVAAVMTQPDSCLGGTQNTFVDHFNIGKPSFAFFGSGGIGYFPAKDTLIDAFPVSLPVTIDSTTFEFSTWFRLDNRDYTSPLINLQLHDSTGRVYRSMEVAAQKSFDHTGPWSRASAFFCLTHQCRSVSCRLTGEGRYSWLAMDELQFRPAATIIISRSPDGHIMANNHLIK